MLTNDEQNNFRLASSSLFDVVVLAGGRGTQLFPINVSHPFKALIPVCNRPLIWHCIKPWLDLGVRHMYILAPIDVMRTLEVELNTFDEFKGASFTFLKVAASPSADDVNSNVSGASGSESGTVDALRSYHQHKQKLPKTDPNSAPRDVLVLSCDTVVAGVNVWSFIRNFYDGFHSASAMYYEPLKPHDTCSATRDCLSLEPAYPNSTSDALHLRVHMAVASDQLDENMAVPAGAIARRLNLTYTSAFVDAHVYLFRSWVLDFINYHRDLVSIRDDLFPMLAGRQLPSIESTEGYKSPSTKLDAGSPIPLDPVIEEPAASATSPHAVLKVSRLNASQHLNPPAWDELRTCVTVFRGNDSARIQRINTLRAYRSYTREVISGLAKKASGGGTAFSQLVGPYAEYQTYRTLKRAVDEAKDEADAVALVQAAQKGFKYSSLLSCPNPSAKVAMCAIGKGVEIGAGSSLRHVVVMSGARIGKGVTLDNCVICCNAEIADDQSLSAVAIDAEGQAHELPSGE